MTDSTTGAVFVRTASGRIGDANEPAGRLLRSPVDALLGTAFDGYLADPYRARLAALDEGLRAGGDRYQLVVPFGPTGTPRLLRVSGLRSGSVVLVDPAATGAGSPEADAASGADLHPGFRQATDRQAPDPQPVTAPLTPVEATLLELTAQGLTTGQIAKRLHYSDSTVNHHLAGLGARFGTNNRTALVSRAYVLGFLRTGAWPPRASATAPAQRGHPMDRVAPPRTAPTATRPG